MCIRDSFLGAMGYSLEEIKGKHHRIFCDKNYVNSQEYKRFWERLAKGEFFVDEFKRLNKNGEEIWIQASYNPLYDENKNIKGVIKFASDITAQKRRNFDYENQIRAISLSQAVIEFDPTGVIQNANENFCNAVGYSLEEIKGKHHRIFCDKDYLNSADYVTFWQDLASGKFKTGEFKRLKKDGSDLYLQATYNPLCDTTGRIYKVIKYATDITPALKARIENEIGSSEAVKVLDALSHGNLNMFMQNEYSGVFKLIKNSINSTISKLVKISNEIKTASMQVSNSCLLYTSRCV